MKKLFLLLLAILLVGAGSGLTMMQESFSALGTTSFYEKDKSPYGGEVLKVYNVGTTSVQKAIVADDGKMSVTEKTVLVPAPPPPQQPPPDPYEFFGMWWGPNSLATLNQTIVFDGTSHHTVFTQTGEGTYTVVTQGDSTIASLRNKQFAPAGTQPLPVPKLEPIKWPKEPPQPIDP